MDPKNPICPPIITIYDTVFYHHLCMRRGGRASTWGVSVAHGEIEPLCVAVGVKVGPKEDVVLCRSPLKNKPRVPK